MTHNIIYNIKNRYIGDFFNLLITLTTTRIKIAHNLMCNKSIQYEYI
jgi:hypothetical protein